MFTENQKIQIGKVLEISQRDLERQVVYQGELITTGIVQAVMTEVTAFSLITNDGVEIFPTESNEGLRLSKTKSREDVRQAIRGLLNFEHTDYGVRLYRG